MTADMNKLPELTTRELTRYSRHLILPEVGSEGQRRLKAARVLVVGAGGLGSPVCLYLAAAGVGTIGIVDFDTVDLSNLQRQILHSTDDVGTSKLKSAQKRLGAMSPDVKVVPHEEKLDASNAHRIIKQYDVVVDGTDNFATRYLINDACVFAKKPNVHGSIFRFEGQASVFAPDQGPCYRCLFPDPPPPDAVPNCAEGGVLGVLAGVIGSIQATETIKVILGLGETLIGRLLIYDALEMRFDFLTLPRDPACPICGNAPTIKTLEDTVVSCAAAMPPSADATDNALAEDEVSATDLRTALSAPKPPFVLDVRNPEEYALCKIDGSTLIPLPQLADRLNELDSKADIVVHCKSGVRSRKAIDLLASKGFTHLRNLRGGILAWIRDVDPTLPTY
jgi:sulfur-carrier protein adenylyltransferase/sulfurtransferase